MHVHTKLSICILNGYPRSSRENFDRSNVGHPHDMYADVLRHYAPGASIDVLFVADPDVSLPTGVALESYDAYIWTGSDLTIYHDDPRVIRQIELARAIFRVGRPMYGSCWGVQMAAVAAGGEVQKNPKGREWGIARDIRLTESGKNSLLHAGKPERFDGFIMHLDEVTRIPSCATLLATNKHTRVQALEVIYERGTFWATQYHPEYNLYEMARLIAARAGALVKEGFFPDTQAVAAYSDQMRTLHEHPDSAELRQALSVGPDVLDAGIRECELRNWIDHLVLPLLSDR
jgi:GMP synthase (glutamine-hydrolysing)